MPKYLPTQLTSATFSCDLLVDVFSKRFRRICRYFLQLIRSDVSGYIDIVHRIQQERPAEIRVAALDDDKAELDTVIHKIEEEAYPVLRLSPLQ